MKTSRSASGYGRGLSKYWYSRLKMAVFAPMPSVRVATATSAKIGCLRSERSA